MSYGGDRSTKSMRASCSTSDGATVRYEHVILLDVLWRESVFETMPRGAAFLEHDDLILIAAVERHGTAEAAASKRLLRTLLVAAAGDEPHAVVTLSGETWIQPSLVDEGAYKRIDPALTADVIAALRGLGRDVVEMSHSVDDPAHGAPSVRIGQQIEDDPLRIDVRCGAPGVTPKETDAMTDEAIWITGPCWIIVAVELGGVANRAASKKLLEELLASPRP